MVIRVYYILHCRTLYDLRDNSTTLLLKRDKLAVQIGDLLSWQVVQGVLVNDARAFVLLVPFFEVGKRDKETLALLGLG